MDFDFSTKAGFQKLIVYIVGILSTIAIGFGISQTKVDSLVQIVTTLTPLISTIAFYIVNQMAATGKAKTEIKKMEIATEAAKQGVTVTTTPCEPTPDEVKPVEVKPAPFDVTGFMDEVNKTVIARYTVSNASTLLYNAEAVLKYWQNGIWQNDKDAKNLLMSMADDAFKGIWGCSYKDAWTYLNDPLERGCPTCNGTTKSCTYPDLKYKARQLGMEYYTALLDYERIAAIQ
jgi:hypothetical protein